MIILAAATVDYGARKEGEPQRPAGKSPRRRHRNQREDGPAKPEEVKTEDGENGP